MKEIIHYHVKGPPPSSSCLGTIVVLGCVIAFLYATAGWYPFNLFLLIGAFAFYGNYCT